MTDPVSMRDITHWALLCTTNDPESLTIVRIARALRIPLLESTQMHGATLAQEPHLHKRLEELGEVRDLAIVEIPGLNEEKILIKKGIAVHVIDHHTYEGLDRMQEHASLTQFLALLDITDVDLENAGFDPKVIRGVALLDQGFVWELGRSVLSEEKKHAAREYYLSCKREIQPKYTDIEQAAEDAWKSREVGSGFVIIHSTSTHHIREAVSFLIADAYQENPPTSIIVEGDGRISVQETDKAEGLFNKYGGFLFGKKRCWGILGKDNPPTVDKIVANLGA
jgi:hypothetical protein